MWNLRGAKHDPSRTSNSDSALDQHAEPMDHNIHPRDAHILERGMMNYDMRLLLESWHSTLNSDTVNEKKN